MTKSYDLIAIGTGTAAAVTANTCRRAGWTVAVVDDLPYGGTCALRGCDPKKMLVAAAEAIDANAKMQEKGVITGAINIDWSALQQFKRSFTDPVPEKREQGFAEKGIDTYHGKARFIGPTQMAIDDVSIDARYIVIAAGAEPASLPIDGVEHLTYSDQFLELEQLPQRIVFIGGGFIGFEFAHIAARAGVDMTILSRSRSPLKNFDPDLVQVLVKRTETLGVTVATEHEAVAVSEHNGTYTVLARTPNGEREFAADLVVHSGGRVPAIADLDLKTANVAFDGHAIALTKYLQSTSNPAIYVAGDAAGTRSPLTPVAALEGKAVAANLLEGNHATVDYAGIPTAVFSIPPLARVGLLEAEARQQNLEFSVKHQEVPHWFTARRVNEPCYAFKTLVEEDTDRVLGAHIVGPEAAEVINLFGLAIRSKLTASDLKYATFAYPTAGSDLESMLP